MRKIRRLRHWKQCYDANAKFVWRKSLTFAGQKFEPGDQVPDDVSRNKLKRLWEGKSIELAEFEAPDVLTGKKKTRKKKNPEPAPETSPVPEPAPETSPVPEPAPETSPVPEPAPETSPAPEPAPETSPAPDADSWLEDGEDNGDEA